MTVTTYTVALTQPVGVLGRVTHKSAVHCAVRHGTNVWVLTGPSEWTLVRDPRTAAAFTPEES